MTAKAKTPAKTPKALSSTDKRDFKAAITRRQNQVMAALKFELEGDLDRIIRGLREQRGIIATPEQIRSQIKEIDDDITHEIQKHIEATRLAIVTQAEDVDEDYNIKERDMQDRHTREWNELRAERKRKKLELKEGLRQAEETVAKERCSDMVAKKRALGSQLEHIRAEESKIQSEARSRQTFAKQYRTRVEMVIQDATGRALEELLVADTVATAKSLVDRIPTIGEALALCQQGSEGISKLVRQLDPKFILPAPPKVAEADPEDEDMIDIVPESASDEIDVEDQWGRRRAESDHRRIYANAGTDDD